jgi:hypothetical protein
MKKLFLILFATLLVACADNGTSAPSEICYSRTIGYDEVCTREFSQYREEWLEKACLKKFEGLDDVCVEYDYNYTMTKLHCVDEVEFH